MNEHTYEVLYDDGHGNELSGWLNVVLHDKGAELYLFDFTGDTEIGGAFVSVADLMCYIR